MRDLQARWKSLVWDFSTERLFHSRSAGFAFVAVLVPSRSPADPAKFSDSAANSPARRFVPACDQLPFPVEREPETAAVCSVLPPSPPPDFQRPAPELKRSRWGMYAERLCWSGGSHSLSSRAGPQTARNGRVSIMVLILNDATLHEGWLNSARMRNKVRVIQRSKLTCRRPDS